MVGMKRPGEQLKMFMTPREIGETVTHYGDFGANTGGLPHEQRGAKFKIRNAQESGMADSIAAEGVKHPIALDHHDDAGMTTVNGHHRLAVQSSLDPDRLMPVTHWTPRTPEGRINMGAFQGDITQDQDPTGNRKRS
jgi:hypothetical protein